MKIHPLTVPDFGKVEHDYAQRKVQLRAPPDPQRVVFRSAERRQAPIDQGEQHQEQEQTTGTKWERLKSWAKEFFTALCCFCKKRKEGARRRHREQQQANVNAGRNAGNQVQDPAAPRRALIANMIKNFVDILEAPNTTTEISIDALCFLTDEVFQAIIDEMAKILEGEQKGMGLLAADFIKMHLDPQNPEYGKIVRAAKAAQVRFPA